MNPYIDLYSNVGASLLNERMARGLTMAQMAVLVQTPESLYRQIEKGTCIYTYPLTLATAVRIASALGLSLDDMCGLTQQKAPLPAGTVGDATVMIQNHRTTAEGGSASMRILVKRPEDFRPKIVHIDGTRESMGEIVGGRLESVSLDTADLVLICNEEGLLLDLPYNMRVCGHDIFGTFFFCKKDGDQLVELPLEYAKLLQEAMLPPALLTAAESPSDCTGF